MQNNLRTVEEYEILKNEGRLIVLDAELDSICYFLSPDCNKCTHAVYKDCSKKCMYNLKTEMCYEHEDWPCFNDSESLGQPEYWQLNETVLSIYCNKLYRGKFGRTIFTNKEEAANIMNILNSGQKIYNIVSDKPLSQSEISYRKLAEERKLVILPCRKNDMFYTIEAECKSCKYKNHGEFQGCNYQHKKGMSPYTCNYCNEIQKCYILNQKTLKSFYFKPKEYKFQEVCLLTESEYDLFRNTPHSDKPEMLLEIIEKMNTK